MSERQIGREPVEIIEITTPKCANTHGTSPCTATETGDAKCFNTRNTCNSTSDYQARPLAHLTPDRIIAQGETGTTDFEGEDLYVVEVDLLIPLNPEGVILDLSSTSGAGSAGIYIGFTAGDLIVRCGSSDTATEYARLSVDPTSYIGGSYKLICVFERDAGVSQTVTAYLFDPVELELVSIGTVTSASDEGAIFDSGVWGVGVANGSVSSPEDDSDYNGTIDLLLMYDNQAVTLFPSQEAYRQRYFFDDGREAKPSDEIYILPLLLNASTVGTRINITAADQRYEPLGRRAFMTVNLADAPHTDFPYDPYLSDRTYDPLEKSTFWAKWLIRNKFGKTRATVKRYTGYRGQSLAQMQVQSYVLDLVNWSNDQIELRSRDYLSLTEFRRTQIPAPTPGKLDSDVDNLVVSIPLTGNVEEFYPTSGTIRINDEIITYTARAYDAVDDHTDFTGLVRGSDGSEASSHGVDDNVQACRRYINARIDDVLAEWTITDSRIPAQVVDLAKFTQEYNTDLSAYTMTGLLTQPTGADQLIGELAEQCSFYVWWNERRQIIDMQAIKPLSTVDRLISLEEGMVEGSFSLIERPDERVTTISFYYNPRDFAGDVDSPVNYKNQLVVSNSETSGPDQYGVLPQTREIFSRWLTSEAQASQTSFRLALRYADVSQYAEFLVDAKDRELWTGDYINLSHYRLVDEFGERDESRRWLIIEAEETEPGHQQKIVCIDVTLDGRIYVITENGIGTYTPELLDLGLAFITENDGTNSDGTMGATIG